MTSTMEGSWWTIKVAWKWCCSRQVLSGTPKWGGQDMMQGTEEQGGAGYIAGMAGWMGERLWGGASHNGGSDSEGSTVSKNSATQSTAERRAAWLQKLQAAEPQHSDAQGLQGAPRGTARGAWGSTVGNTPQATHHAGHQEPERQALAPEWSETETDECPDQGSGGMPRPLCTSNPPGHLY